MRSPLMRVLAVGIALLAVGTAQTLLHNAWAPLGLIDGMMIAVGLVALRATFAEAVWTGAVGGLIQDALGGGIVGLHAFAKTAVAAAVAVLADLLAIRGQLAEALIVAAATAGEVLIVRLLLLFLGWPGAAGPLAALAQAGMTGLACGLITVGLPAVAARWQRWRRRPGLRWR